MSTIVPVILSGGVGSRLWPVSRRDRPKQLAPLVGSRTLVQDTAARAAAITGAAAPVVVCGAAHCSAIIEQLGDVGLDPGTVIVEPVGRSTAPAVAAAALTLAPDDIMVVLPADHVITDTAAFTAAVEAAAHAAADRLVVTFGITPTEPATAYGYIAHGPPHPVAEGADTIAAFVEKPDRQTAIGYLEAGTYSWNSGMFVMRAATYLEELAAHRPDILEGTKAALPPRGGDGPIMLDPVRFAQCPADSIDYAVMEHTTRGAVIALDAGWSDIGSWSALWALADKNGSGNVVSGAAYLEDVTNSFVEAGSRPVAVLGLDGVVVIDAGDAVLVTSLEHSQEVRKVVDRLEADGRPEI